MNWPDRFMAQARLVASWSKIKTTKVGAVIVDAKNRVVSQGYNGLPRGIEDTEDRLIDREEAKLLACHAEANAIDNRGSNSIEGCTIYCTHHPCIDCAKRLIQNGISKIVYETPVTQEFRERWNVAKVEEILAEAGIEVEFYEKESQVRPGRTWKFLRRGPIIQPLKAGTFRIGIDTIEFVEAKG